MLEPPPSKFDRALGLAAEHLPFAPPELSRHEVAAERRRSRRRRWKRRVRRRINSLVGQR